MARRDETQRWKRPLSPSTLKEMQKSPINFILKRLDYTTSGTGPVVPVGYSIHSVMEEAFGSIKKFQEEAKKTGKMPGEKVIRSFLGDIAAKARYNLTVAGLSDSSTVSEAKFASEMIKHYGEMVLKDPSIAMFVESPLVSDELSSMFTTRSVADLILLKNYRTEGGKKLADSVTIVDWKSFADLPFTNFAKLNSDPQKAMNRVLASKVFNTEDVSFVYAVNRSTLERAAAKDPVVKSLMNNYITQAVMNRTLHDSLLIPFETELDSEAGLLSMQIQRAESLQQMLKNQAMARGEMGVVNLVRDLINPNSPIGSEVGCGKQCNICLIREICPYSSFIENAKLDPVIGEKDLPKTPKKVSVLAEPEYKRMLKGYERGFGVGSSQFLKRTDDVTSIGKELHEAYLNSYQANMAYGRKEFIKSKLAGSAEVATGKLPFLLTNQNVDFGYFSRASKYMLEHHTRGYINLISQTLGLGKNEATLVTEEVIDTALRDKKIVGELVHDMFANTAKSTLEEHTYLHKLPFEQQLELVSDTARSFTRESILAYYKNLNQTVIDVIERTVGKDPIVRKFGPDAMKIFEERSLDIIMTPESSSKILAHADEALRGIKTSAVRAEIVPRAIMAGAKFPLSMAAASGILIWALNHISQTQQWRQSAAKALGTMDLQEKKSIEASNHYSTYQSVRRLLLTDFGSPTRAGVLKPSRLASEIATKARDYFSVWKDVVTQTLSKVRQEFKPMVQAASISIDNFLLDLPEDSAKRMFLIGGIGGTVVALTPLIASDIDKRRTRTRRDVEGRKRKLKRFKQASTYNRSQIREPESELREAYKLHTPFASVTMPEFAGAFFSAFERLAPTADNMWKIVSRWKSPYALMKDVNSKLTNLLTLKRQGIAEAASLTLFERTPEKLVEREMESVIPKLTNDITAARVAIGSRKQTQAAVRLSREGTLLDREVLEKIERFKETLGAFSYEIPERDPQPMPVVKRPRVARHTQTAIGSFREESSPILLRLKGFTHKALPEVEKAETMLDLPRKLREPKHVFPDVANSIMLRERYSSILPPDARELEQLMRTHAESRMLSVLKPASGSSQKTRFQAKLAEDIVKHIPLSQTLPQEYAFVQSVKLRDPLEISWVMTTKTKQLARNYSYGGYNTTRFADILFGE